MKPTLLFTVLLAAFCHANAQTVFVRQGAIGNGTSWADATGDLDAVLRQAAAGAQIWVAKGTYKPTAAADRTASFEVKDGVRLIGSFAGSEASIEDRNIVANLTILSGEIGQPGHADNSFNVIFIKNAGDQTLLDGFTITGGNANGEQHQEGTRTRCGGGVFIDGENGLAKPVLRNCTFQYNLAREGAAVYNNGRNGESSPTFLACVFQNNEATADGGALYNDGRMAGKSNPILEGCTFEKNMATYGGAIFNGVESGVCNLTISNCNFTQNAAYLRGGALFSLNGQEKCYMEMSDCQFDQNFPDDQNMIFTTTAARSQAYKIN